MTDLSKAVLPANTIIKSPLLIDIPTIDVASYVFSSGTPKSRGSPLYYDAEHPSQNFSLLEAEVLVKRFARGLQKFGLRTGDKVLLYAGNKLYFPIVLWSVIAAGCVFTGASPAASSSEVEYQLRDSETKVLLTSYEGIESALKAAKGAGIPLSSVFVFGDPGERLTGLSIRPWTDIWASSDEVNSWSWERLTKFDEVNSRTAVINYSSGTTGLPKGVEVTHYNLVANSEQVLFKRDRYSGTSLSQIRQRNIETLGERWLAPLPMYHAYGQTYQCLSAARLGAKVFVMSKFTLEKYMQFLDIYRITFMSTVPTILTMLHKYEYPERYNLKSVEVVTSGSAPLDGALAQSVTSKFLRSGVKVKQGWGMTETTCSVTGFAPDDDDEGKSIGWLNPNCAAKVVPTDEDGEARSTGDSQGSIGELWVAGPQMVKGYWKNDRATKETIIESDGYRWVRTGDIGFIDGRECIYIVDRLKELIKVKGLQVAPAELQLALVTHPDVQDAAVVGAKINGQEHPRAFIVRKSTSVKEENIFNFIKERFARHKWLTGGVYFVDVIPRTPSGKVQKRKLPTIPTDRPAKL